MEEFGVSEIVATLGLSLFVLYVDGALNMRPIPIQKPYLSPIPMDTNQYQAR